MLNREQMIEEIQNKIVRKNNIKNKDFLTCEKCLGLGYYAGHDECWDSEGIHDCSSCPIKIQCEKCETRGYIRGHPISLSRVLSALGKGYSYIVSFGEIKYETLDKTFYIARDINKSDGSDAMLNDQSDETIQAIHTILSEK